MNELVPVDPAQPEREEELAEGYYACTAAIGDFAPGDIVYLLETEGERLLVVRGEHQWRVGRAEFTASFAFDPEGLAHRMAEVAAAQAAGTEGLAALRAFNPHIDEAGDPTGLSLVPAGDASPGVTKRQVAEVRNAAARLRQDLESRAQVVKAFAEEQALILRKQTDALMSVLKVAEEAVWTINLYLGQDEEIVRLAEGAPAPADTPITIRQLVLYMDEECAVAAEEGGIDAREIDAFDEWLTADPAHLAQVFPEQKGMVALKPRRKRRDYGDPWMDKAMADANRKTYFLLRNGENLFRMWTSYEVGDRLIPRTDEFLAFFSERHYNWETRQDEVIQLKPGSDAFMKAEKAAASHKRHYMRAALILQGLIDRTPVFHPLATKINVGDQASYEKALSVVLDADAMLTDGRERFKDWFRRINSELAVGMRIVGCFGSFEHGLRIYDAEKSWGHRNSRISPNGAGYPADAALYTLEDKRDGGFVFYFARSGSNWRSWDGDGAWQKRASCVVEKTDQFILNFDAATVEEMDYYLRSRLDRSEYTYLFPTLKLAIRLKREEAAAEAPFRLLLAGQIAMAHGVDVADAEAAIPALVHWWKFKNRTHRALTADDAKALRMIVAEFGHRATQGAVRDERADEAPRVLAAILAAEPDALLVAHKAGPEYVALVPANDEDVFVHEQTWTARGRKDTREWRVVDSRPARWQILHTSPRWAAWKRGAVRAEHLSDPERDAIVAAGWAAQRAQREHRASWRKQPVEQALPLAAAARRDGKIELYFDDGGDELPTANLLTSRIKSPDLGHGTVEWKRDARRQPVVERFLEGHISYDAGMPWEVTYDRKPFGGKVLWRDDAAIAAFRGRAEEARTRGVERRVLELVVHEAFGAMEAQYKAAAEAEARAKFAADYGDPELWEGHKKTLRLPSHLDAKDLRTALSILVERGLSVAGLTAGEIVEAAAELSGRALAIDEALRSLRVPVATAATAMDDEEDDPEPSEAFEVDFLGE